MQVVLVISLVVVLYLYLVLFYLLFPLLLLVSQPTPHFLNAARIVQGIGSGFLTPQGVGMIQQYFHGKERGWAFGLFGTTVGLSVALGPVLGGLLIKVFGVDLGWRLTFLINLPAGILTMTLAWLWFPRPLFAAEKLKRQVGLKRLIPLAQSF
ncbi:hypothetical protein OURE66S_02421 [Oligella ureolytica]